MVAIRKKRLGVVAVPPKDTVSSQQLPVVESLTPGIIDLLARVVIDAQKKELEPYAEIVKAQQKALLRALHRDSGAGGDCGGPGTLF